MGVFGATNDNVNEEVESATNEKDFEEDWGMIITICDKAGKSNDDAKNYLKAITKRLFNTDPHIGVKAVTLLDACIKNSGNNFHVEVASRQFEIDFTKLMTKAHPEVAKKLRESLRRWSENEFKSNPQLSLIPTLYSKLKENYDFPSETHVKKVVVPNKDPDVVESQEEEEQILKAIELSLKEAGSPRSSAPASQSQSFLYPSVSVEASEMVVPSVSATNAVKEPRKVRALYDFQAAEDNELTFSSGEIIFLTDDTDPNWWKGSNQRGEGLFPANFVTSDLSVEPDKFLYEKAKKMVQFKETAEVKAERNDLEDVEIDEGKIDRLLHLLHEADPTNPDTDTDEMLGLEREVNAMGPLIDTELERVDRKHAQLTQLSANLVEALGLYHTLMREPQYPPVNKLPFGVYAPPSPMNYNSLPLPANHQHQQQPPMVHGMVHGHEQRQQFVPQPQPQPQPQPFAQQFQAMPPGHGAAPPANLPPHLHDGRHEAPFHVPAVMSNFGVPSLVMPQPNFPPSGHSSQTNLQPNGPPPQSQSQQGPHFVGSSTHMSR